MVELQDLYMCASYLNRLSKMLFVFLFRLLKKLLILFFISSIKKPLITISLDAQSKDTVFNGFCLLKLFSQIKFTKTLKNFLNVSSCKSFLSILTFWLFDPNERNTSHKLSFELVIKSSFNHVIRWLQIFLNNICTSF